VTGRALVVQADALRLPLPDECVDLIVTSPPYWSLRRYDAAGIGNEATPLEWLEALWAATAEMKRVLKPSGSIFVNLGDKYNSAASGQKGTTSVYNGGDPAKNKWANDPRIQQRGTTTGTVREKSLLGLPGLYAAGCSGMLAAIGGPDPGLNLIWRRDQITEGTWIWHKLNGLPESVTDRTRSAHEYVFHLTKQPRYYAALDTLREPHGEPWRSTGRMENRGSKGVDGGANNGFGLTGETPREYNPLGKLPGSVWSIPSDPLRLPAWLGVDHYAAFPPELPRRLIFAFSPPGICVECGEGRRPVVDKSEAYRAHRAATGMFGNSLRHEGEGRRPPDAPPMGATILGWACSCTPFTDHPGTGEVTVGHHDVGRMDGYPNVGAGWGGKQGLGDRPKVGPWREFHLDGWRPPPTTPAVVADVFGGTGTTAMVARALGRIGLSFDLSHAYSLAAQYRVFESGEWQQVIERTTGRKARPLPKHDPAQERLAL
jgi:DNA modification methylase